MTFLEIMSFLIMLQLTAGFCYTASIKSGNVNNMKTLLELFDAKSEAELQQKFDDLTDEDLQVGLKHVCNMVADSAKKENRKGG